MNALISISVKRWMLESVTCQRWVCHTQSSMTEACFPCFQGSLSPPAYFNHQSTRCQTNLLEFHHSQSFFPPEHILATSHSAPAQQTLFFVSRVRFFFKDSTTIQIFACLPFLSFLRRKSFIVINLCKNQNVFITYEG